MNRITRLLATVVVASLVACASEPMRDHHYSLVLAADDVPALASARWEGARLNIGRIRLAQYLEQSGLAMQRGEQQIEIANHRFWAEPLDEAIAKVLVRDIAHRDSSLIVAREAGRSLGESDCHLRLEIDKFQATDTATVVARGRYWIRSERTNRVSQSEFDLERELSVDGYANAVIQLRVLLGELSDQVVAAIAKDGLCEL